MKTKSRRHVFMFQPRFAPGVLDGSKPTTIRPERKRKVRVGDILDLRQWSGRPYASKQIKLREVECVAVEIILITRTHASTCHERFGGITLYTNQWLDKLARADGFKNFADMRAWFEQTHGLPFIGTLYRWRAK